MSGLPAEVGGPGSAARGLAAEHDSVWPEPGAGLCDAWHAAGSGHVSQWVRGGDVGSPEGVVEGRARCEI